jgi:hypothetical protein
LPSTAEIKELYAFIDGFSVVQLAVNDPHAAGAVEELLYATDSSWIADRLAEQTSFPRAMFGDVLWPILVDHLLRTRTVALRWPNPEHTTRYRTGVILALFKGSSIEIAFEDLVSRLQVVSDLNVLIDYLARIELQINYPNGEFPEWPNELASIVTPLWQKFEARHGITPRSIALPPSFLMESRNKPSIRLFSKVSPENRKAFNDWRGVLHYSSSERLIDPALVPDLLSACILSGLKIVRRPGSRP